MISFSRIAFNQSREEALVETGNVSGVLCGSGNLIYLRKVGGLWEIVGSIMTWIS